MPEQPFSGLVQQMDEEMAGHLGLGDGKSREDMGHPVENISAVGDAALVQHLVEADGVGIKDLPGAGDVPDGGG